MSDENKKLISKIVIERERLRNVGRVTRLMRDPRRALPFYLLAVISHLIPYKISFKTLWGKKMTCYLPEGNTFYYYGYCEANLTNFFIRLVKAGDHFFDVGAHVGFYSMLTSLLVESTGKVVSFEPTPWTYLLLEKNVSGLANVGTINKAVGDSEGVVALHDYGPGYGAYNSLNKKWAETMLKNRKKSRILVEATTLDDYCSRNSIYPNVLKIDTEGFEFQVLQGAKNLIVQNSAGPRPVIALEVAGGKSWATPQRQAIEFLVNQRFVPCEISTDGSLRQGILQDNYSYDNLAFIPEERLSELAYLFKP